MHLLLNIDMKKGNAKIIDIVYKINWKAV